MRIVKTGEKTRSRRWCIPTENAEPVYFPSRRAAECWRDTGKTFKTNPEFAVVKGRTSQKRIR